MSERKRRDWSLHFLLSSCDSVFFLREYYFASPNGEGMWNWIRNHISKFHNNSTVNESRIIVLLKQFWVSAKKKIVIKRVFLSASTSFYNSQQWECSDEFLPWCSNFMTIQRWMSPRSSFFWDRFDNIREQEKVFGEGEGKTKLRERGGINVKTDLTHLCL